MSRRLGNQVQPRRSISRPSRHPHLALQPMISPSGASGVRHRELGWFLSNQSQNGASTVVLDQLLLMPRSSVSNPNTLDASPAMMWLGTGRVLTEYPALVEYGTGTVNINRQFVTGVQLASDGGLAYLWDPGATLHNTGRSLLSCGHCQLNILPYEHLDAESGVCFTVGHRFLDFANRSHCHSDSRGGISAASGVGPWERRDLSLSRGKVWHGRTERSPTTMETSGGRPRV